jgi:hypothetical protein
MKPIRPPGNRPGAFLPELREVGREDRRGDDSRRCHFLSLEKTDVFVRYSVVEGGGGVEGIVVRGHRGLEVARSTFPFRSYAAQAITR